MGSYNRVILLGNLTRDPEVRFASNGTAIVKFGLAVNERYKQDEEWLERVNFFDVTLFGKRGEAFSRFHEKGKPAFVEGKLRYDTWDDKQTGQKRSKVVVIAENWEFVSGNDKDRGGSSDASSDRSYEPAASTGGFPDDSDAPF